MNTTRRMLTALIAATLVLAPATALALEPENTTTTPQAPVETATTGTETTNGASAEPDNVLDVDDGADTAECREDGELTLDEGAPSSIDELEPVQAGSDSLPAAQATTQPDTPSMVPGQVGLSIINADRSKYGKAPLKNFQISHNTAHWFAYKIANGCTAAALADCHMDTFLGGGSARYRQSLLSSQGWGNGGDLLGRGFANEEQFVRALLMSPGHRAWLMDDNGAMEGIGIGKDAQSWVLWIVGRPTGNPNRTITSNTWATAKVIEPGSGTMVTPKPTLNLNVYRYSGSCRYSTAADVARFNMKVGDPVFLVSGKDFPDALSASAAASKVGGFILLTDPKSLPEATRSVLATYKPKNIYVVGGNSAVSDAVASQARSVSGGKLTRISGSGRYETSRAVAQFFFPTFAEVFIATGANYPDALAASAAAGAKGAPLVLVNGSAPTLDAPTKTLLANARTKTARIAGGVSVVSSGVESSLRSSGATTYRYGGSDRYDTAAIMSRLVSTSSTTVWLASGQNFPDALTASAVSGQKKQPLLLTKQTCMPTTVFQQVKTLKATKSIAVGGVSVLTDKAAGGTSC